MEETMKKIKIAIVDDEPLIRGGLTTILNDYEEIEVVGSASNGEEALSFVKNHDVDVLLMDIRMPVMDGVDATKEIKAYKDKIKIIILTTFNDDEYIKEAIQNGASGYLLKDSDYDQIYESIRTISKGNIVINKDALDSILLSNPSKNINKAKEIYALTDQEIRIIKEVAQGKSNKQIADVLFLSEGTIKNNITSILAKLLLRSRTQLTAFAYQNRIVE